MIPPEVSDPIRVVAAVLAVLLIVAAAYAVVVSFHMDQRVRFGLFAAFGFLQVSGHLAAWGRDGPWRLPVLAALVAAALWSTIIYVRRELKARARGAHADDHDPPGGRHV